MVVVMVMVMVVVVMVMAIAMAMAVVIVTNQNDNSKAAIYSQHMSCPDESRNNGGDTTAPRQWLGSCTIRLLLGVFS